MVTMTVGRPGWGVNDSKSGAMRLMPMITPSTGRSANARDASASENVSTLLISTSVMAYPCSRAAPMMPSSIVRLPTCVMSYAHSPTERYLPPRSDRPA